MTRFNAGVLLSLEMPLSFPLSMTVLLRLSMRVLLRLSMTVLLRLSMTVLLRLSMPLLVTLSMPVLLIARPALAQSVVAAQPTALVPRSLDAAHLDETMADLARQALAVYREPDRGAYLDNRFRLQITAGRAADALDTIAQLRASLPPERARTAGAVAAPQEIFGRAQLPPAAGAREETLRRSFREVFARFDDRTAAMVNVYVLDVPALQRALETALAEARGKRTLTLVETLALVRAYELAKVYGALGPLLPALVDEEDRRRYFVDKDVRVPLRDGATLCALVMRPRVGGRLPALLNFTIYADARTTGAEARRSAANGYAAVEGYTRGKACSPDRAVPIEHDGEDAAQLVDWIAAQPWSDGRVGMYGGSYEGFTQWAAAKHLPPALKALMPSVTFAPGIDFPNPGGVYQNYGYPWPFYTTDEKALDDATYDDQPRWDRLNRSWYTSGRAYRDLPAIDGKPNPIWDRWLAHPTYDAYWQHAIPYRDEFARIGIPVLTTTGYYDDGQVGALYYFSQHYRYRPSAEHYLVIGPYNHIGGQRGTFNGPTGAPLPLLGYALDPAAAIDIGELRYQWFDHVFKGAPKPALLRDRVNYEVMGANLWKHAPSLAAMANRKLTFHLSAAEADGFHRLTATAVRGAPLKMTVDLPQRSAGDCVSSAANDSWNGSDSLVAAPSLRDAVAFAGEPLTQPMELSGFFSGTLALTTNKRDFDFDIQLYERTPDGKFMQLSYFLSRASHAHDLEQRRLLEPGRRQRIDFTSRIMTSRQLRAGSRLIVVVAVVKRCDMEIDYGSGKNVSDETIADAGAPLTLELSSDSVITVPVF